MKPSEWIEKIKKTKNFPEFPIDRFKKSCLIYSKRVYGIFLLEDVNGKYFTAKVKIQELVKDTEDTIGLYLKHFASHIPNLLYPEDIYDGLNPIYYHIFTKSELNGPFCKNADIRDIFLPEHKKYYYYITKACDYNLGYYLGKYGGKYSYDAFVGFTFQLLVGLQTLHRLGVYHGDLKPANILICSSEIAETNRILTYKFGNIKKWNISYDVLENKDMKIIDYGTSIVHDDIESSSSIFENEISIALVSIIKIMWNKVTNKLNVDDYEDLIVRLKECKTDIADVMINAPIFEPLDNENVGYVVNLLTY